MTDAQIVSPVVKLTQIRINRALQSPGAKGKRGFLLWVNAAFPARVANALAVAASKHIPPGGFAGLGYGPRTLWKTPGTFGYTPRQSFGFLGDDASGLQDLSVDTVSLTPSTTEAITNATDSGAADSSWASDLASAFSSVLPALGQAYVAKTQLSDAQTIFNTNLQRAQQGLPPIPTNPTQYGLPAPTVNLGVSSSTLTPILLVGGGAVLLLALAMSGRKSRS